jgi:MFS family permease
LRRVFPLLAASLIVEASLFAAVAPLLPEYSQQHDLSKAAAGVLVGAHPAGTFVSAIPLGWLAARWGVKPTLLASLALIAVSSAAFGFAQDIVFLDAARFMQGVGGAGVSAAAMSWVVAVSPPERRGEKLGLAVGASIVGILVGPGLGGFATAVGTEAIFGGVAAAAAVLALLTLAMPAPEAHKRGALDHLRVALTRPAVLAGLWVFMVPGVLAGLIEVLEPLRLSGLGASGPLIGAIFVGCAAIEAVASPLAGRLSDRRGRRRPLQVGFTVAAITAVGLPAVDSTVLITVCLAVGFVAIGLCWAPGMANLSDAALAAHLPLPMAFSVSNLAWSAGHLTGATAGAPLAAAWSDAGAYGLVALLCVVTLGATLGRRHPVFHDVGHGG